MLISRNPLNSKPKEYKGILIEEFSNYNDYYENKKKFFFRLGGLNVEKVVVIYTTQSNVFRWEALSNNNKVERFEYNFNGQLDMTEILKGAVDWLSGKIPATQSEIQMLLEAGLDPFLFEL